MERKRMARGLPALMAILGSMGCSADQRQDGCALEPSSSLELSVTDTTDWELGGTGGRRAVLWWGPDVLDSIDAGFGYHQVGLDSILYLRIRSTLEADVILMDGPTDYVVATPSGAWPITDAVPYFSTWFSSPTVVGRCLLYWGFDPAGTAPVTYAGRYRFGDGRSELVVLPMDPPHTDDMGYFRPPYPREGGGHVFESRGGSYEVDWASGRVGEGP